MTAIIFVTHSTSEDNELGLASGHHDTPLSALGFGRLSTFAQIRNLARAHPAGTPSRP